MELPTMMVRSPPADSGRGVTAGSTQAASSSSTSPGEHCHVTFTDQSASGKISASRADVEGFQQQPPPPSSSSKQQPPQQLLPSQQHLNPLYDVPDAVGSSADVGKPSPTDPRVGGSSGGGKKSPFSPIPLALAEKPSLGKRQSTKQLLKPKNALEVEVGPRDTMEKIAIRYRTTPSEICKMNKMASRMIFPGQILFVADPDASPVTPSPTKEGAGVDVMFPAVSAAAAAAAEDQTQHKSSSKDVEGDASKLPSLPSLPSFTSVSAITGGVSEASKDAGAAASSQFSSLISILNPATAISRSSLRKKKSDGSEAEKNKGGGGGGASGGGGSSSDLDPDQECLERFLKLAAKHITDGDGVVSGTLLVTPNAIMFDPHVMDPLVKEHSAERYGMMAPMECVMSATLYHDISRMSVEGTERKQSHMLKPAYRGGVDSEGAAAAVDDEENREDGESADNRDSAEHRLSVALGESTSTTPKRRVTIASNQAHRSAAGAASALAEEPIRSRNYSLASPRPVVKAEDAGMMPSSANASATTASADLDDSVFDSSTVETPVSANKVLLSPAVGRPSLSSVGPDHIEIHVDRDAQPGNAPNTSNYVTTQLPLTTSQTSSINNPSSTTSNSRTTTTTTTAPQLHNEGSAEPDSEGASVRAPDGRSDEPVPTAVWYADLTASLSSKPDLSESGFHSSSSGSASVRVENVVDPNRTTEQLFQPIRNILPKNEEKASSSSSSLSSQQPPMFLCLKVGQPLNKRVPTSGPIASYAKKKRRPEYWFSIPKDCAPRLYAFFLQWTPEVYDNRDEQHHQAFVVLGNCDEAEDDFIKTLQISKEWEIINTDEIERRRSVLSMDESSLLPDLVGRSSIFEEELVKRIHDVLPARAVGYPWTLVFSTEENGFSLNSLYRKMSATPQGPVLMFIKDTQDKIFGAMSSCTFIVSDHFYGNGEMFLFSQLEDGELAHWPWSGENSFFIKGNKESLAIGAGEGLFGLWLDEDLYHGRSHPCSTFANECLSSKEDFVIKALEVWAFLL